MSYFETIIINIIILFFPLMVYIFYVTYSQNILNKEKTIFLDFALFSSIYLLIRYNVSNNSGELLMLLNVPLIIAYQKQKCLSSLIISIIIIIQCGFNYILIINYLILFLLFVIMKRIKKSTKYLLPFIVLNIVSIILIVSLNEHFIPILKTLFLITIFVVIIYFADCIFRKCEEIVNLNISMKAIEKDKKFRVSLFKITHEIKNPIAVCKSYLDMFDINNREHEKYIYIVKDEMNKILLLLQDFLAMNKIKIEKELLDINLLLEDTEFQLEDFARKSGVDFDCQFLDDEIFIEGDYNRLSQVFINLIKNSIEANATLIDIKTKIYEKNIIITLKDNGIGISEENLERISEPFYTTKKNGTGLGVSLSCEIITAHNGTISYFSEEGLGTEVKIVLPISNCY